MFANQAAAVRKLRAGARIARIAALPLRASAKLLLHAQANSHSAARVLPLQQPVIADILLSVSLSPMLDTVIELCQGGHCS
jgi:hypothetical protein